MPTSSITKEFYAKDKESFDKLKEEIEENSEPREIKESQSLLPCLLLHHKGVPESP